MKVSLGQARTQPSLPGEIPVRFEKAFGVDRETLMGMHASYDFAQTRSWAKQVHVPRYKPHAA